MSKIPGNASILTFRASEAALTDPLGFAQQQVAIHNSYVFRLFMPFKKGAIVLGKSNLERILSTHRDQFLAGPAMDFISIIMGGDVESKVLLAMDGEELREIRRLLGPAFTRGKFPGFVTNLDTLLDRHLADVPDGQVDFGPLLANLMFVHGFEMVFGREPGSDVFDAWDAIGAGLLTIFHVGGKWARAEQAGAYLRDRVKHILAEIQGAPINSRQSMAQLLLAADEVLPEKILLANLLTLVSAANETTRGALLWMLELLLRHPEAFARVKAELAPEGIGTTVTFEQLQQTPYTDAAFTEEQRLAGTASYLFRVAKGKGIRLFRNDDEVEPSIEIDDGTTLLINTNFTQHDARYFPEPEQYRPERWLGDTLPPNFAMLGFGGRHDPHSCLAIYLAPVLVKCVLAKLLRTFNFTPLHGALPKQIYSPTGRPEGDTRLVVTRR